MQGPQTAMQTSGRKYRVAIVGAGCIGGFLGAILAQDADVELMFFGREAIGLDWAAHGLSARWQQGEQHYQAAAPAVAFYTSYVSLIEADVLLLTVKATALATLLHQIKPHLRPDVPVLALQNGIGITDIIASQLHNPCYRAIVPFNVVNAAAGRYLQTSSGALVWPATERPIVQYLAAVLLAQGLALQFTTDLQAAEYGKLLLNLNNALNAISDLPLRAQLLNRHWRRLLASAMGEWLLICAREQVTPTRYTAVAPAQIPAVLRLPNWLFRMIASKMLRIDPAARLSMYADLQAGRRSEVMFLNGAVVALGKLHQIDTPVNQRIVELVQQRERYSDSRMPDPAQLCRELGLG
jgi:2-dehydropantoate 2-reductase